MHEISIFTSHLSRIAQWMSVPIPRTNHFSMIMKMKTLSFLTCFFLLTLVRVESAKGTSNDDKGLGKGGLGKGKGGLGKGGLGKGDYDYPKAGRTYSCELKEFVGQKKAPRKLLGVHVVNKNRFDQAKYISQTLTIVTEGDVTTPDEGLISTDWEYSIDDPKYSDHGAGFINVYSREREPCYNLDFDETKLIEGAALRINRNSWDVMCNSIDITDEV